MRAVERGLKDRGRAILRLIAAGIWLSSVLGCTPGASERGAPEVSASPCSLAPDAALSEARRVVAKRCVACHSQSGVAADYDWTNEHSLILHRRNVAAQVGQGSMPPAGYPALGAEERRALLCWANSS